MVEKINMSMFDNMFVFITLLLSIALSVAGQGFTDVSIVVTTIPRLATTSRWVTTTATKQSHTVTYSELQISRWTLYKLSTYSATASNVLSNISVTFTPAPSDPSPVSGFSSASAITSPPTPPIPAPQSSPVIFSGNDKKISSAALAGLLIGVIAIVIVLLIVAVWGYKKKNGRSELDAPLPLATRDESGNWIDAEGCRIMDTAISFQHAAPEVLSPVPEHDLEVQTPESVPYIPDYPLNALSTPRHRARQGRLRRTDDWQLPLPPQTSDTDSESSFNDSKRDQQREATRAQLEGESENSPARPYTPSVYSREEDGSTTADHVSKK